MSDNVLDLPTSFTYATARAAGLSDRHLRHLLKDGTLVRTSRGVYRKTEVPLGNLDLIEIVLRAPEATICLASALSHHNLTDTIPPVFHLALPRSRHAPLVTPPVRWHRFQEDTFKIGRELVKVDKDLFLGVYSAQRCIVDAFRLRHQEGEEVAVEALRRWLQQRGSVPAELLALAKSFPKAKPSLHRALRLLL